jgi:protein-serine/threonine kinase
MHRGSSARADSLRRHLVHASDADQYEALLGRWGPDRQGKLGGPSASYTHIHTPDASPADPRWANPIKNMVRQKNQARAVAEVVGAMHPSQSTTQATPTTQYPPLRVMNGMPTPTASTITTAAVENSSRLTSPPRSPVTGGPANSTLRWGGLGAVSGLPAHAEAHEHEASEDAPGDADDASSLGSDETALLHRRGASPPPAPPRAPISPSLATLEKAVAARIFFENLYFPLFRQPSSRDQRRAAFEADMAQMRLPEAHKDALRARWRQNETDYLRERRRKVDPSAFVVLKTIGHGACERAWCNVARRC